MDLTPRCPRAGPTGGEGVAFPDGTSNLNVVLVKTFFDIWTFKVVSVLSHRPLRKIEMHCLQNQRRAKAPLVWTQSSTSSSESDSINPKNYKSTVQTHGIMATAGSLFYPISRRAELDQPKIPGINAPPTSPCSYTGVPCSYGTNPCNGIIAACNNITAMPVWIGAIVCTVLCLICYFNPKWPKPFGGPNHS